MAPKKADAAPGPPLVDTNPYGAFVNLTIDAANLEFSAPVEGVLDEPKSRLEVVYSSEWAPLSSDVKEGGSGPCEYAFKSAFRWDDTRDDMVRLINSSVKVHIMDPVAHCSLGSCSLDMLPFALGAQEFELKDVEITPADEVADTALFTLVSATLPSIHVALTIRERVEVAPEGEGPPAAAEGAEAALPEPQPYRFIAESECDGCNVLELRVEDVQGLPAAVPGVCSAAKEGKAPGKMSFSVGVKVAEGVTVVLPSGVVHCEVAAKGAPTEGQLVFEPASTRVWISKQMNQAMQYAIEDGDPLHVEIARYLSHDSLADPAWEYYHAVGGLKKAVALTEPGSTFFDEKLLGLESFSTSENESILPAYEMPAGKSKPIEEPPPAGPDGGYPCAWKEAATSMSVSIKFARPVFPPWRPPRKPERPLPELLPQRIIHPHVPPAGATQGFKTLVSDMAASLLSLASSQGVSGGSQKRANALLAELKRTGKDLDLQMALRKAVVDVIREHFQKAHDAGIGPAPNGPDSIAKALMHNALFTFLSDQMNGALSELGLLPGGAASGAGAGGCDASAVACDQQPESENAKEVSRLANLALECEAQGLFSRAEQIHQRRVLATERKSAAVWIEYGCMLMRAAGEVSAGMGFGGSGRGRAEECFRTALALSPDSLDAKLSLAAVLLHQGCFTDPLLLSSSAEVINQVLREVPRGDATCSVAWSFLWLISSSREGGDGAYEAEELQKLEEELSSAGHVPASANGLFAAAKMLLDLGLPALSTKALKQLPDILPTTSGELAYERAMLMARGCSMLDDPESKELSQQALQEAASLAPAGDLEPDILAGHIHYAAADYTAAVHSYYEALIKSADSNPSGIPLRMYLQMAQAYINLGHPDYALDVYVQACARLPDSSSVWLGVALSRMALKEYPEAELALAEANRKDPEHPLVWGNMALMALRTRRFEEANLSLKCAMRFGLSEPKLTGALATEYIALGQFQPAVALLRASIAESESVDTHIQLMELWCQMGEMEKVQAQLEVALALPASEEQAAQLEKISVLLSTMGAEL